MAIGVEEEYEALLQFLYMAPIGLMQTRLDGEILMVNPLCAQLLMPLSRDGDMANLFIAMESVAPDLRQRVQAFGPPHGMVCDSLQLQVNAGQAGRKDVQFLSLSLLKLDAHRLMVVLSDVSQSVKRDRELQRSQAWIQTIMTGITDYALLSLDDQGRVQHWHTGVERVTGFDSAATVGRSFALFYPGDTMPAERVLDRLHEADASGWSLDEGWRMRADGSRYWGSSLIAPLHGPNEVEPEERAYSLILRDVSEHREASEALRQSISCDHLTGLANRRAFFEAAELEIQRWTRAPRPLSLVMVDADLFKSVNDQHGHAAGDAVLRHLAAGLLSTFRAMDVVARIGGEEFVVLLPGTTLEGAEMVAERLCRNIAQQVVDVDGVAIRYTVSAGVAEMEPGVAGLDALVKRADMALYSAKTHGRNRVERWRADTTRPQAAPLPV